MANIQQLCRTIDARPDIPTLPQVNVRTYEGESDIAPWLDLRHRAFARQRVGVRQWTRDDFLNEFVHHWWWKPQRMWLAEVRPQEANPTESPKLVGSVTLAMRGQPEQARPVVHWLMVFPAWRRRGIGRLLMAHLETAAWDAGFRQIWLETHAAWDAAARFYESLGYLPDEH